MDFYKEYHYKPAPRCGNCENMEDVDSDGLGRKCLEIKNIVCSFSICDKYIPNKITKLNNQRHELENAIEHIGKLDDDWDTYGSSAIPKNVINTSKYLLSNLSDSELPCFICPVSGGESIQFEWELCEYFLEIGIASDFVEYLSGDDDSSSEGIVFEYENKDDFDINSIKELVNNYAKR